MIKNTFKYYFLSAIAMCSTFAVSGQVLTNQTTLTIQSGLEVTVQGDLLNEGAGDIALEGRLTVEGNITNNSSANLTTGNGEIVLDGTAEQIISGSQSSRFASISLNNAAGLKLDQNIQIDALYTIASGNTNLNGQTIDLGGTGVIGGELNSQRIFGSTGMITAVRELNAPNGSNIAGMGIAITSGSNLGATTIERTHGAQTVGTGNSIERAFNIIPTNNTGLGATLRIDYFDDELNGQDPNTLNQWRLGNGATNWTPGLVTNSGAGFVEGSPYNSMALWTLSADGTSGIGDLLPQLSVKYYPNPLQSGNQLKVEGLTRGEFDLVLTDARGRKVWETNSKVSAPGMIQEYNLPELAEGVYSLQIISEEYAPTTGLIQIRGN